VQAALCGAQKLLRSEKTVAEAASARADRAREWNFHAVLTELPHDRAVDVRVHFGIATRVSGEIKENTTFCCISVIPICPFRDYFCTVVFASTDDGFGLIVPLPPSFTA
jgi:hypothetical protein